MSSRNLKNYLRKYVNILKFLHCDEMSVHDEELLTFDGNYGRLDIAETCKFPPAVLFVLVKFLFKYSLKKNTDHLMNSYHSASFVGRSVAEIS